MFVGLNESSSYWDVSKICFIQLASFPNTSLVMAISFIVYLQARPWRKSRTLTRTRRVTRREMTKMVSTSFFRLLLEYAYSSIQQSGGSEKFGFRPGSFSFILVLEHQFK